MSNVVKLDDFRKPIECCLLLFNEDDEYHVAIQNRETKDILFDETYRQPPTDSEVGAVVSWFLNTRSNHVMVDE